MKIAKAAAVMLCAVITAMLVTVGITGADYSGVKLAASVTADMLDADYWLTDADSDVIMTANQIKAFNKKSLAFFTENGLMNNMKAFPKTYSGKAIRSYLESYGLENFNCYVNGKKITDEYKAAIKANENYDGIADKVTVKYGIMLDRTELRAFPTEDFASDIADDLYYDNFNQAECYINEPVAILHRSADGKWYYVAGERFFGWVQKEKIALCTRSTWLKQQKTPTDFIVVTGKKLVLDSDPYRASLGEAVLYMGDTLALAGKNDNYSAAFKNRVPYGCYIVKIPSVDEKGVFKQGYAAIPVNEDVSRGYLEYTGENRLRQAYKLLGSVYGWSGDYFANDCSGILLQIYRCFGIKLPRNGTQQAKTPATIISLEDMTDGEKFSAIAALPSGTILRMPGHVVFYLGERGGKLYALSSAGSFYPKNNPDNNEFDDEDALNVNTVVVNTLDTRRKNGKTWLSNLTTAVVIE